jgi:hypothetical protein
MFLVTHILLSALFLYLLLRIPRGAPRGARILILVGTLLLVGLLLATAIPLLPASVVDWPAMLLTTVLVAIAVVAGHLTARGQSRF